MITIVYRNGKKEKINQSKMFCGEKVHVETSGNFVIIKYFYYDEDSGIHLPGNTRYIPLGLIKEVEEDLK